MENLDKALAERVEDLANITPDVVEKVVAAHVEYYMIDGLIGMIVYSIFAVVTIIVGAVSFSVDEFGGGYIASFICFILSMLFIGLAAGSYVQNTHPEAYTIKQLTSKILGE